MDLTILVGYLTGLYWVREDIDPAHLLPTAALVHVVDAFFCYLVATQNGKNRKLWTVAGLLLGIWAVAGLFFLSARKSPRQSAKP